MGTVTNENVGVKLESGCNVELSEDVFDNCFSNFDDSKYLSFSHIINSGLYFPQILQFITVLICIFAGKVDFVSLFCCNLIFGIGYTVMWYVAKLYRISGISFISCLIGGNVFRFYLTRIGISNYFSCDTKRLAYYCFLFGRRNCNTIN